MATILVVDDRPINRQFLVTLLGYAGHRLLEAADGTQALDIARNERPDLVITDILMPRMDGCDLARQLQADPVLASTPLIFYTATYRLSEAHALAREAGVAQVLSKPSNPKVILDTVAATLGANAPPPSLALPPPATGTADAPPAQQATAIHALFTERMLNLEAVSLQLTALIELGFNLTAEREPEKLLELFCHAARKLMGARYAAIGILGRNGQRLRHFVASGMDPGNRIHLSRPLTRAPLLCRVLHERRPVRLAKAEVIAQSADFPAAHPRLESFLGVPLVSSKERYGWLYFGDKLDSTAFSEADERTAVTLAAQAVVGYENAQVHALLQRHAAKLQREVSERQQAERKFRGLLEAAPDAMVVANAEGRITFVNSQTATLFDYAPAELVGQPLEILIPESAHHRHRQHRERYSSAPSFRPMGSSGPDLRGRRRDGSEFPVEISLSPLESEEGLLITAAIRDITERERAKKQLQEAGLRLQSLSNRVLEAQEEERRRIAHELHDEIGQALTAMKINLEFALQLPEQSDRTRRLEECVHITEQTLRQVRSLSLDLRPPQLEELGLVAALRWHVDRLAKTGSIAHHFTADSISRRLPPAIETACFRVAQEALTNVARHAQAKQVWISLRKRKSELHLTVRDDGRGFDVLAARRQAAEGASIGLVGMEERVRLVGGHLEISAGKGTEIRAIFPLPARWRTVDMDERERVR